MKRSKRLQRILAIVLFCGAHEASAYITFFSPFQDFSQTWIGVGDIPLSGTGCVVSSTAGSLIEIIFGGGSAVPYQLRMVMASGSPNTPFSLTNGTDTLPVSFSVTDLIGGGTQNLSPNQYSNSLNYQYTCSSLGNNAALNFFVSQADLYGVPAGTYSQNFNLRARRTDSGQIANQTGLNATVVVPSLVQISNIDDINLGAYDGVSPFVSYNETFCVYTNTTAYTIAPSSGTMGAGAGSFALDNAGNLLEYTVRVDNSIDASAGALLTNGQTSAALAPNQSTPLSVNCNGGDNAAVYLRFDGPQLQSALPGSYSGVLNLRVSPI